MVEGAAGFFDAAVSEALAGFEGGGEALAGEFVFAEAEVRDAAEMETVGFARHIGSQALPNGRARCERFGGLCGRPRRRVFCISGRAERQFQMVKRNCATPDVAE